jgi:dienelactone hydrolase
MPDETTIRLMHQLIQIKCPWLPSGKSFATWRPRSAAAQDNWMHTVLRYLLRVLVIYVVAVLALVVSAFAEERRADRAIREEVWAIPVTIPTIAYVVRPEGDGPFPLVVMNHGVSLNQRERSFFPIVEFRDAAMWFARRGYMVVAPSGTGYGAAALDEPERGLYSSFYSKIGSCDNPNFSDAGLAVALLDKWIIDYMADQKLIVPNNVIVVGQSAGGWAAIALSSRNVPGVRAIITFAAGRGGRVGGKPNNNCAPDKLVAATGAFGRTARVPMLWIYVENDTFFGPALSKRMYQAYTEAGGAAEYHLLPPFGSDGHFLIDSADAIPLWAPLVSQFLDSRR